MAQYKGIPKGKMKKRPEARLTPSFESGLFYCALKLIARLKGNYLSG
jgi:hypothetical protein